MRRCLSSIWVNGWSLFPCRSILLPSHWRKAGRVGITPRRRTLNCERSRSWTRWRCSVWRTGSGLWKAPLRMAALRNPGADTRHWARTLSTATALATRPTLPPTPRIRASAVAPASNSKWRERQPRHQHPSYARYKNIPLRFIGHSGSGEYFNFYRHS